MDEKTPLFMRRTTGDDTGLLDLMICRIPGLKGKERVELQKKFDNEGDFSVLSMKDIESILGRVLKARPWTMADMRAMAERDAETIRKLGIHRVSWREKNYPPLLREIFDPPALVFYRGILPDPEKPFAAVVGTRKPSAEAARRAFVFGKELGELGIPVVSGLALGIDTMAHRGNIEGKSPTAAVLGSSPDQVYPSSNRGLARRIVESGGVILSEYPPGTGPMRWNFPARNRIISGLARGTLIVEAPEKSGALITARFALEQNRDLWLDRAGVDSAGSAGMARLAEEGAALVSSARDILAEWKMLPPEKEYGRENRKGIAHNDVSGAGLAGSLAEYLEINL